MSTWLNSILNTIWLSICKVIYVFINWLYQVFETVANVNLFSEEVFRDITSRIYIIMGIAMLFIFAYNLILMIINPDDKKSTGSTTKLVKETIISLIVIVLLPTIFNYMYVFQGHILSTNIIGQIIMGGIGSTSGNSSNCAPDDYNCSCDFSDFDEIKKYGTGTDGNALAEGFTEDDKDVYQSLVDACNSYKNLKDSQRGAYSIAPTIFSAFYRPATYDMNECEEYLRTGSSNLIDTDQKKQVCTNFFYDINMAKYTGNINAFVSDSYLKLTMSTDEGLIEFDWLFAIVAGGLAVWMFLCYAMEIGVRVAKLGVLQIISPIAVMMRIVPSQGGGENNMYKTWFDELKNTYIDVFIRLIIIFFALFAISLVPDVIETLFSSVYSGEANWFLQTLSLVIVILGILKFAQEAPELLKTFFKGAGSGNFALRSPGKQLGDNKLAMGGLGMAGGLTKTGVGNTIRAFKQNRKEGKGVIRSSLSGMRHGLGGVVAGGYRGFKEGYKTNDLANLGDSVDRAKALSDERYAKRDTRRVLRDNDANTFLAARNIDANEHKFLKGAVAGTVGRYKAVGRSVGDFFENVESWGGTSAYDDVKIKANQAVKDYQSKLASRIDTKGNISGITEGREDLKKKIASRELNIHDLVNKGIIKETDGKYYDIKGNKVESNDIVGMEGAIHAAYSETIDEGRAAALMNASGIDLKEWKQSIENLTQSMKENSDFLDNFSGPDGFLVKDIGEKFNIDDKSEFKKAFSGSIDDFNKGLNDYLEKDEKFRKENKEIAKAFAVAIDKIGSTNDANIRMATNQKQAKSGK